MLRLTSYELRQKWINYFQKHHHMFLEPRSLIPDNDPSLLFINSGVSTLKPYFSGQITPPAKQLVNCQKAIRTNDIENVGKTSRHHTLFEMLGNFSIGDYFKKKAIWFGIDFLTNELQIPLEKLYFTVYKDDHEAYQCWIDLGIDPSYIWKGDADRNFWDVDFGPCGSCSEIFYDRGPNYDPQKLGIKLFHEDIENDRYIEIWNIVFSEFNNDGHENFTPLLQKNIDTGAGLERLLAILQDVPTNFDTDLFQGIIHAVEEFSNYKYKTENYFHQLPEQSKINRIYCIIADHLRAIVLALADGVIFDNKGRGYILRRLMRRMVCLSKTINLKSDFLIAGIKAIIVNLGDYYTNIKTNYDQIHRFLINEFELFNRTLEQAWKILTNMLEKALNQQLNSYEVFKLVETHGFPKEFLDEILEEKKFSYDHTEYDQWFHEHQKISKKAIASHAMAAQNDALIKFNLPSKFDYFTSELKAKVIGLFDCKWNFQTNLNHQSGYIILDQTCLYACSGGQEADHGTIAGFAVDNVFKGYHNQNVHFVHDATLAIDQVVSVKHNRIRRDQLSRQHSSEHLLHAALKNILSNEIKQEGAAKSFHKISLDFRYHLRPTVEQLNAFENFVNQKISEAHNVKIELTTLQEAKRRGANAYFEDTYKKQSGLLRLVTISPQSLELCGGTHVSNTREIENFIILGFESKGAGAWRIEGLSGNQAINVFLVSEQAKIQSIYEQLKKSLNLNYVANDELKNWSQQFQFEPNLFLWRKNLQLIKQFKQFVVDHHAQIAHNQKKQLTDHLKKIALLNFKKNCLVIHELEDIDPKLINAAINSFFNELNDCLFIVFNLKSTIKQYYLAASKKFWTTHQSNANECAQIISQKFQGRGGGRFEVAQGSFGVEFANQTISEFLRKHLKLGF